MKLIPSRPVTIQAVRNDTRMFPALHKIGDGSLLMFVQCGHDAHFVPGGRSRSFDGGHTWLDDEANVPRCQTVHTFADGTLLELDIHGFHDPAHPNTFGFYGAWSNPSASCVGHAGHSAFYHGEKYQGEDWLNAADGPAAPVSREIFRVEAPSATLMSLASMKGDYPHYPWWPLISHLYPEELQNDVQLGGPYLVDTLEVGKRLLAIGYVHHNADKPETGDSVFIYESLNRGHNWREISIVARGTGETAEGFNESTLTQLKDGRLYSVIRSGDGLYNCWSEDEGLSWSSPTLLCVTDSDIQPRDVWPRVAKLDDGTLVLAYGRPGKHLLFDPSGTGENWQGHLDLHAWELETQVLMGVPVNQRLRGDTAGEIVRYWDSGDYLSVVPVGPREMLVTYDVQNYIEHENAAPISGVRMVRVRLSG